MSGFLKIETGLKDVYGFELFENGEVETPDSAG